MNASNVLTTHQLQLIHAAYRPFRHAKLAVACLQADGIIIQANPQMAKLLKYSHEQLLGAPIAQFCAQEQLHSTRERLSALFQGQLNGYRVRRELICQDNSTLDVAVSVSAITDSEETTLAALVILSDISTNTEQTLELRKLSYAVEKSGSAVLITDPSGIIEYANPRFCDMTGYRLDELIGQSPNLLRSDKTPAELYRDLWDSILQHKQWRGTLVNRRKDGSHYWAFQSIAPILDDNNALVNIVSVSDDISRIKEHERQMEQLAYYDPLTSLGNRRNFRDSLDRLISTQSSTYSALMLLDLDHFKQINDTLGHDIGDELLTAIAGRLRFCTGEHSSVFRLGGDEFTVLIQQADTIQHIEEEARNIIDLLAQPLHIGAHEIQITVSLGITLIHQDGDQAGGLLKNADLAMYDAKRSGRNTFAFYRPQMDYAAKRALSLELDLRHAIEHNGLSLYFQPLVDLNSGKIFGLEALCRWEHPLEGQVSPHEFISKAEETGLIIPLGYWVIQQAFSALAQLQQQGFGALSMAINLSGRQFSDRSLLSRLEQALHTYQLDASRITLEITESSLLYETHGALQTFQRMKALGFKLAIDDFGTGFSSLSLLKQMPVDILKIDRSFVMDLPDNRDSAVISTTVIAMAEKLELQIQAEGVETAAQQTYLLDHHCHSGQGFFFSKPLPWDQLQRYLTDAAGV